MREISIEAFKALSKGKKLEALYDKLDYFYIPKLFTFSIEEVRKNGITSILDRVDQLFGKTRLAIRSSAQNEDGELSSKAGAFDSFLNIDSKNRLSIENAIDKIEKSYQKFGEDINAQPNEIIIQEFISDSVMSGVVFSQELNTGAPYYVINYDDISGLTNTVTSGDGDYANRTLYVLRGKASNLRSPRFQALIKAVDELENFIGSSMLDIEFALDANLRAYLLQVRPITTEPNWNRAISKKIINELNGIENFILERLKPKAHIYGETTILGQMPDWNPAEMIGRAPRALAYSLYSELITKSSWRLARELMGYAVPEGQWLMTSLAGQPYIDTRLSFHSFTCKRLNKTIADKLVSFWIDQLGKNPQYHDKVEFKVAITSFDFSCKERIEQIPTSILSNEEKSSFYNSLVDLTVPLIKGDGDSSIKDSIEKLILLDNATSAWKDFSLNSLLTLVSICKKNGTIPFSILARHGFIAKSLLNSLIDTGVCSNDEINGFQYSIKTVASEFVDDLKILGDNKEHDLKLFMKIWALRPGTYDILSPRYDQLDPEELLNGLHTPKSNSTRHIKNNM